MSRTYNEIMEELEEKAEFELVVSTARVESEESDGNNCLALVTIDGVTRGVLRRETLEQALEEASDLACLGEDVGAQRLLRAAIEEVGIDRAVELLERQR